jgi:hypothetical protein
MLGEELYVEILAKHVPSNGTVVQIFTHPENDLDGEFYVHVRYDMDLMINSHAYEILLICG